MSASEAELVKNGELTTFYMRLLDNVNRKLDNKIDSAAKGLLTDFEQKKAELSKSKKRLEDLHKIKVSIQDINTFYKYPNKAELAKKEVKSLRFDNKPCNPSITNRNILDTLENIDIKIDNGDYVQLVQRATSTTSAPLSTLLKESDTDISSYTRLCINKKSNVVKIDYKKSGFETAQMNIVLHFKGHKVNPEFLNIRYLTLPNEPKQMFSYINTVLGSNDGVKWENIGNINLSAMRNFEKATLFKYPVPLKTPQFYEYLCFQSQGTKEVIPKEHIAKLSSRTTIPICNFELFGNYYRNSVIIPNNKVEEDFQKFFEQYVNTTYSSTSSRTEIEYLVKMTLEAYKELSDVITECKLNNVKVINSAGSSSRASEGNYTNTPALEKSEVPELAYEPPLKISEEPPVPEYSEEPKEGQELDPSAAYAAYATNATNATDATDAADANDAYATDDAYATNDAHELKEDDIDADLMTLMNNTKKNTTTKKVKILDTETNSITLGGNRDKKKKKANK
jgi:hypothetical protein